jgi:hypothetical protein
LVIASTHDSHLNVCWKTCNFVTNGLGPHCCKKLMFRSNKKSEILVDVIFVITDFFFFFLNYLLHLLYSLTMVIACTEREREREREIERFHKIGYVQ